ncbi:MAG: DNA cytosine methyltransferase [Anaerolineae bacterium]|nr:DNA cytosine methyltransferase [Anaerolineae bacterium]MDQ7033924.1 DNA cytosine methyltransferase [Anaerolineae bacterium]
MRVIDLFSGCGGMSQGFKQAGYELVAAYDNWTAAVAVYRANFDHPIFEVDLSTLKSVENIQSFQPDMIIGGPPCQDFSSAGKRDESQGRADLTMTFAEIVACVKPEWFVMENVDRIRKSSVLHQTKSILKNAGYGLTESILNANLCGVPQNRKRYFLVGELDSYDGVLTPYFEKNLADKLLTIHDYLGDSLGIEYYYRHPRSYQRRGIFSIYEPSPTIRGVNRPIPSTYKQHPNDAAPNTRSLRALTTIERSYIQTFPKDFTFEGTKTNLEQMIGNAVPVRQAEYIAKCIFEYIADKTNDNLIENTASTQLQLL